MSGIEVFAADLAYSSPYSGHSGHSGHSGRCLIRDVRGLSAISASKTEAIATANHLRQRFSI